MFHTKRMLALVIAGLAVATAFAPADTFAQPAPAVQEIEVIVEGGYKPNASKLAKAKPFGCGSSARSMAPARRKCCFRSLASSASSRPISPL